LALGPSVGELRPDLAPLLASFTARRLAFEVERGAAVPSPARTVGGTFGWRVGRDLRAASFADTWTAALPRTASPPVPAAADSGAGFEELARTVGERIPVLSQTRGRWSGLIHTGPAGLPLVAECAGSSLFAILGLGALGHAWAFAAARRAADYVDGRPATASPLGPPDRTTASGGC
jgi:hypothetical protein